MVSPMPAGADVAAALLAPEDGLLASSSPLSFSFPSPGVGRTPGAHVVQEGRLSLEMFGLAVEAGLAGQPGTVMDLLAPSNSDALARATAAGALKGSAIPHPNPPTANQQPKLTPPALAAATTEQMNAKDAYAEKLKQALPDKLAAEAAQIIDRSKASLGLPGLDAARTEAAVSGVLAENGADGGAGAAALPRLPTFEPQQLEQRGAGGAAEPPPRAPRRAAAKRGRDPEDDVDPATLPPPKRIERMESGYEELRQAVYSGRALEVALRQARAELAALREENDNLWAATAHIGAAMHAAIEERDAAAGAGPVALPALGPYPPAAQLAAAGRHHAEMLPPEEPPAPGLVPVAPPPSAGPLLTPGTAGLAALFSPSGDDLFAACDMFVSPMDAHGGAGAHPPIRGPLFPEQAGAGEGGPRPAASDDKSFSFKL